MQEPLILLSALAKGCYSKFSRTFPADSDDRKSVAASLVLDSEELSNTLRNIHEGSVDGSMASIQMDIESQVASLLYKTLALSYILDLNPAILIQKKTAGML